MGTHAWAIVEKMYPETKIWETHTPYFEKRNIHFYVNKCGFKIVAFYNPRNQDPNMPHTSGDGMDYSFRFEKVMINPKISSNDKR